ncbi:MAG: hypothetical protein IPL08_17200 [Saprospiraceae bacterium]|nr:hypothetical protein [Saprospiraceae bacterium]
MGESDDLMTEEIPLLKNIFHHKYRRKIVREISNEDNLHVQEDVSELGPGLYIIIASDVNGALYQGKFIKM